MLSRLRERLSNALAIVICLVWLVIAVTIAVGVLDVEPRRSNLWIPTLIFLSPAAVVLLGGELVHRLRNGPQPPGRHSTSPEK